MTGVADPKRKAPAGPSVAGLGLMAADTGRLLMLQRAIGDPDDPAAGTWELPGGHLEADDATSLHGAMREWSEEVGQDVPPGGVMAHVWTSPNRIYQGHLLVIPRETDLDLSKPRTHKNPDDDSEQVAWWSLPDAAKNPALRRECRSFPWDALRSALTAARRTMQPEGKAGMGDAVEVKAKVASEAGERRYRKPIGTELGQARNAQAQAAQDNPRARDQYETLVNANPRDYRAMLDDLSAADLKALAATAYSFRSSNPTVVQARIALAGAMRRQGLDVNDYGGLGRSGGGSRSSGNGKATGKRKGKGTAVPRSRTASRRGVNVVAKGPQDANKLTAGQVARLRADGWRGDPNDRSETLYPPGHRQAIKSGEPMDDIEVKRTTAKPWETGKIKKAGHTISQEKGEDGDKYPIKTIGDIAAAIKRAKGIKDPEQRDKVRKHIRAEARRLKATNMIPADWSTGGSGSKSAGFAGVITTDDRALLAAIEAKVMSPNPGAVKLRNYWAKGKGRAKWKPGTPGDFERLRKHLRKYVPAHMLNGLTANIHKLATGQWPGRGRGHGKSGQPESAETKGLMSLDKAELAAYDEWEDRENGGDGDDDALMLSLDRYEDMAEEVTAEDEYERALAEEIDWELEMDGTPFPADDDDEDDDDRPAPLPQAPADAGLDALDALFAAT